jgi:hypothetical protein
MKRTLLFLIFLLPLTLWAQKGILSPEKNDNVIVVSTDTLNKTALEKASFTLINQGFTIREKDKVKGTLTTDPYSYDKGMLVINIEVSSNEIKIYGMFEPNLAIISGANNPRQLTRKIHYEEAEGSSVRRAWNIMDAFANQLAQSLQASVTYLKW